MAEFEKEIADLKIRGGANGVETRLLALGVVLGLAGIVIVIVGWYGASGTAVLTDQIPYIISGGLLGVAVAVIGAALYVRFSLARYFRYWLVRLIYEQRAQTDRTVDALSRIESALGARDRTPT